MIDPPTEKLGDDWPILLKIGLGLLSMFSAIAIRVTSAENKMTFGQIIGNSVGTMATFYLAFLVFFAYSYSFVSIIGFSGVVAVLGWPVIFKVVESFLVKKSK